MDMYLTDLVYERCPANNQQNGQAVGRSCMQCVIQEINPSSKTASHPTRVASQPFVVIVLLCEDIVK